MSFFCKLPFIEIQVSERTVKPCCVFRPNTQTSLDNYFNNPEMVEVKQKLLSGQAPDQCTTCVNREKIDGNSFRIVAENSQPELSKEIIERNDPTYFDIQGVSYTTSNVCNLKCLPCNGSASYGRGVELTKLKLIPNAGTVMRNTDYSKLLELDFERLTVLGGEPFYDQITFDLLNDLVTSGKSQNIRVDINTNMTAITERHMDFLTRNFKHVLIKASIDGIGPVNDYLRYPSKWETIERNIELVKSYKDVSLVVTSAISNLALIKFYQVVEWAADNQFNLFITTVGNPLLLTPTFLPAELKQQLLPIYQKLKEKLAGQVWSHTEQSIDSCIHMCSNTTTDTTTWPDFKDWIGRHDAHRGTSVIATFPELIDYM